MGVATFSSAPGSSLVQQVYFNLTDDQIALEAIELVMVTLNITGVPGTSLGEISSTAINILDDDGKTCVVATAPLPGIIWLVNSPYPRAVPACCYVFLIVLSLF